MTNLCFRASAAVFSASFSAFNSATSAFNLRHEICFCALGFYNLLNLSLKSWNFSNTAGFHLHNLLFQVVDLIPQNTSSFSTWTAWALGGSRHLALLHLQIHGLKNRVASTLCCSAQCVHWAVKIPRSCLRSDYAKKISKNTWWNISFS